MTRCAVSPGPVRDLGKSPRELPRPGDEHRLVCIVAEAEIIILAARYRLLITADQRADTA